MSPTHISPYSGAWYPAPADDLARLLDGCFEESRQRTGAHLFRNGLAFVVPHAGPAYCGAVAAAVYRSLSLDPPERVGLHILVQQFIRSQFRAIRWQAENPDLRRMLCQPSTDRPRLVYRVTIHNQKHFPPGLPRQPQQTAKKIQKHPCRETLTKNHEGQPPPIGDGRDHVAAKALTGAHHHRRLPATSPGSSRWMVRTKAHLV